MAWHVHYVDETGSTNSDLLAMARDGAPGGTVLRAGHQTAGRGRLGRSWVARPGAALLVSILLRPEEGPSFWDTAAVAVAAAAACRATCGAEALLKWPNDLVFDDRKLAGILAEADADSGAVVVGCGLNIDRPADPDLADTAVALADLVDTPPSSAELLDALLRELDVVLTGGRDVLRTRWTACSATLGRRVRVDTPGGAVTGTANGIDETGALLVDGRAIHAGDVVHLRPA